MKLTRFLAYLLTLCLLAGCVAGCGQEESAPDLPGTSEVQPSDTETADPTTTQAPTSTTASTVATDDTKPTQSTTDGHQKPTRSTTTSVTKAPTTTSSSGKHVVTYTTESTTTTTTKDKSKGKAIKILAIGNSFSVDAMQNHLFPIFESAGYTDITLGNLYIGGCSLDVHYANLKNMTAAYTFYLNTDGEWEQRGGATTATGFGAAIWDVVTIQQVSSDSGRPHTYANLQKVLDIIKQKESRAKIFWHMTWAYQQNSPHEAFAHYNGDQMTMYKAITDTVQEQVLPLSDVSGIIPAGTAIQNLRTSGLGDTLTSDGHHLKDTYGDYTAALTWFCALTGEKPEAVKYCPGTVSDYQDEIIQSVKNALSKPFAVTECK